MPEKAEKPHHLGHRKRLRERFLNAGASALADYELLEMILFSAHPRGDVKPLAKQLIAHFGSFASVIRADASALHAIDGVHDATIAALKVIQASAEALLREEMRARPVVQSWTALLDYCRLRLGHKSHEEFHILFLDQKFGVIADEMQQRGTVNHSPVYPREVAKRALEMGATGIIIVHNHPSGDVTPSQADIEITKQVQRAVGALNIRLHDHLIISAKGHFSFKSHGLLEG